MELTTEAQGQLFDQLPGFLETISHIQNKGFFGRFRTGVEAYQGNVQSISIEGTGYIPNDEEYMSLGSRLLVDVPTTLTTARDLVRDRKLKTNHFSSKVETTVWDKYDEEGENVIGSKGSVITFNLLLCFICSE